MKIYDISQEVFSCVVFPGDPAPEQERVSAIANGSVCNLTKFSMCAHNGTHVDAPYHFLDHGKRIHEVSLERFIGPSFVIAHNGCVSGDDAKAILAKARQIDDECWKRILLKGDAEVSLEAAAVFAEAEILLIGNESQTIGPVNAPMDVHLKLLGKEVVLLEGIRLEEVPEGGYLLNAAPLNLGGCDGAPCRAVLIKG
ncbi:MAG: cyclase family protein [Blautia sp.]|nr:cyclase family protein [Blautia sp.]